MAAPRKAKTPRRLLRPAEIVSVPRTYPAIRWKTTLGLDADTTLGVADLDLDGQIDIVAPAVDGPAVLRLDGRGAVVWRFPLSKPATAGPALGDVDGDGTLDVVVAVENVVLCLNSRGVLKWRAQIPGKQDDGQNVEIKAAPTIADLDGDGRAETLVGATDGKMHCFDSQGREKWNLTTKSWIVGGTAVADLDNDGQKEVIFGSYDRNLYCLRSDGRQKWKYGVDDWAGSSPVIGDIDGDGVLEILFASDDGVLRCLTRTGTLKWKHRVARPETRMKPYLALADLDGDGTLETLVPTPDGRLQVFLSDGQLAWSSYGAASVSAPLVADFDGDGYQDILLAAQDGTLRGLSAWGQERFRLDVGEGIQSTPVLADTDRDGKWNLYVANRMSEGETGFLSCYKMTTRGGKATWLTLKGDPYRTGFVPNAVSYGSTAARGVDYATAWAPYGQSERPLTGTLAPRKLRVSLLPLDDARGNRDGALDPGETAWMRVKVENLGKGPSFDDLLTLDFGPSFLKLDRTSAYVGYLAPGATKTATFRVTAPPLEEIKRQTVFRDINDVQLLDADEPDSTSGVPGKTRVRVRRLRSGKLVRQRVPAKSASLRLTYGPQTLRMSVLESGVSAALANAVVFNVPPLPPTLKIARVQILDGRSAKTNGNGNGRLDAGENVVLRVTLRNTDLTTAQNALAVLGSGSSDVLVATQQVPFKDVVPYGDRTIEFSLRVAPRPLAKSAKLKLSTYAITRGGDRLTRAQTLSFPLGVRSLDTVPPQIALDSPRLAIGSTRAATFRISGQLRDSSPIASLMFERKKAPLLPGNRFAFVRPLKVGENVFPISASDAYGNTTTRFIRLVRQP